MYCGCFESSPSALRSSWMQVTSASSLTTVPRHTFANSSCLDTGEPGRSSSALNTSAALRVSRTSLPFSQSRAVAGSKLKWLNVRCAMKSRPNPGSVPGFSDPRP